MTQQEKLARLTNYGTRYECIIENGKQKVLLAYSHGRSRNDVLKIARVHGVKLVALTGNEELTFAKKASDGAIMGDWKIRFSGRTQRDCYLEGENPFIEDLITA